MSCCVSCVLHTNGFKMYSLECPRSQIVVRRSRNSAADILLFLLLFLLFEVNSALAPHAIISAVCSHVSREKHKRLETSTTNLPAVGNLRFEEKISGKHNTRLTY